ncbi:probable polypeptide N-acetylgalactosaminyltransferase 8 [Gracilinanus agilis]|uniref:probable polypeptide N-acetylgalactosaminyltransferase 8 n=1 Tax=Gracilinanus agilis TaxID=191870 RepID=UPI001CFF4C28|nr:probable polypeptide N-acetylgalactosaminyltransferase 8 [Gracilinanus agilis]
MTPVKVEDRGNNSSAFLKNRIHHKLQKKVFLQSTFFQKWGEDLTKAQQIQALVLFSMYGYNVYLSDHLPLNRSIPDTRPLRCLNKKYPLQLPTLSVVITFGDEALSVLQRAITSIINRTPSHLLKELILVDDFSSNEDLKEDLDKQIQLYNLKYSGLLTLIRHTKRKGIVSARLSGGQAATADVVVFLDGHTEVNVEWAEPILARIQKDHTVVVSPTIDKILSNTLEVEQYPLTSIGFNWRLFGHYDYLSVNLKDDIIPIKSPTIMDFFAASRTFLEEIGSLDTGMLFYGAEKTELSLRVWQCGGKIEILPCSRIAHLQQTIEPSPLMILPLMKYSALQVAEVWMDKYKYMVYLAWNLPLESHGMDFGVVSSWIELRKKLKCKSFDWYLRNVYPVLMPIQNIVGYGAMKNSVNEMICMDQGNIEGNTPAMHNCNGYRKQFVYYHLTGELYVGPLHADIYSNDRCLTDPGEGWKPELVSCQDATLRKLNMYWNFKQETQLPTGHSAVGANIVFAKTSPKKTLPQTLLLPPCTIGELSQFGEIGYALMMDRSGAWKNPLLTSSWARTKNETLNDQGSNDSTLQSIKQPKVKQKEEPMMLKDEKKTVPQPWNFMKEEEAPDKSQRNLFTDSVLLRYWGKGLTEDSRTKPRNSSSN